MTEIEANFPGRTGTIHCRYQHKNNNLKFKKSYFGGTGKHIKNGSANTSPYPYLVVKYIQ